MIVFTKKIVGIADIMLLFIKFIAAVQVLQCKPVRTAVFEIFYGYTNSTRPSCPNLVN
jgi:hypothetical protein